jgi:hypothetical protein
MQGEEKITRETKYQYSEDGVLQSVTTTEVITNPRDYETEYEDEDEVELSWGDDEDDETFGDGESEEDNEDDEDDADEDNEPDGKRNSWLKDIESMLDEFKLECENPPYTPKHLYAPDNQPTPCVCDECEDGPCFIEEEEIDLTEAIKTVGLAALITSAICVGSRIVKRLLKRE